MFNILLFLFIGLATKSISYLCFVLFLFYFGTRLKHTGAAGGSITNAAHKRHGKKKIRKLERKLAEGTYQY